MTNLSKLVPDPVESVYLHVTHKPCYYSLLTSLLPLGYVHNNVNI